MVRRFEKGSSKEGTSRRTEEGAGASSRPARGPKKDAPGGAKKFGAGPRPEGRGGAGGRKPFGAGAGRPTSSGKPGGAGGASSRPGRPFVKRTEGAGGEGSGERPRGAGSSRPTTGRKPFGAGAGRPSFSDKPGAGKAPARHARPYAKREDGESGGSSRPSAERKPYGAGAGAGRPKFGGKPAGAGGPSRPARPYVKRGEGESGAGPRERPRDGAFRPSTERKPYGAGAGAGRPKFGGKPGGAGGSSRPARPFVKRGEGESGEGSRERPRDGAFRPSTDRKPFGAGAGRPKFGGKPAGGGASSRPARPFVKRGEGESGDAPAERPRGSASRPPSARKFFEDRPGLKRAGRPAAPKRVGSATEERREDRDTDFRKPAFSKAPLTRYSERPTEAPEGDEDARPRPEARPRSGGAGYEKRPPFRKDESSGAAPKRTFASRAERQEFRTGGPKRSFGPARDGERPARPSAPRTGEKRPYPSRDERPRPAGKPGERTGGDYKRPVSTRSGTGMEGGRSFPKKPRERVVDEAPKSAVQPLELDRAYSASHMGIMRVAYGTMSRARTASQFQELQTILRATGGEAVCRAFSRADVGDRDFWAIWEDSVSGDYYFTSENPWETEIPFHLPSGWFRLDGRLLKWRKETEAGKDLYVLRHRATAPVKNGEELGRQEEGVRQEEPAAVQSETAVEEEPARQDEAVTQDEAVLQEEAGGEAEADIQEDTDRELED